MTLTPEEQRALDYQTQQKRRAAFQRSLQASFSGSKAAYNTLLAKYAPLKRS